MAISSPIKPSTFIVPSRLKELKAINVLSKQLYEEKKTRYKLEKRLYSLEKRSAEKSQLAEKESGQESSKVSTKKSAGKFLYRQGVGLGSALFDFLKFFITYKAVEWVSKPENSKKVLSIVKALKGIFDFVSWFVTGTIDNTFSGLHSVIFGENLLERFLGFFKLLVGLFGFRYLLKPGKLFKDLSFVIKNGGKILEVFNTFRKAGIKESSKALLQTLPKTAEIFKRGLARGLGRGLLKVFGKGGVRILSKLLGPAFKAVRNIVLGPIKAVAKTTVKGIPIVGPLLDLGINLILGDPIDKAIVKAAGSALGMGLGGLIGSAFPGPGTIVGGALGGLLGDWAGDKLYGWVKGLFSKKSDDVPQLAVGGIVTQPTKAIIGEAGPEAVIPLGQLYSGAILSGPLGMLGSSIIGGVNAVLFSMGTIGNIIRPFAQQLFAPFTKEFGVSRFTFASNLGNTTIDSSAIDKKTKQPSDKQLEKIVGSNKQLTLIATKSSTKKTRYNSGNSVRELLADIFNNIMNLDTSAPGAGGPGGRPGDVNTSGSFAGSANAEKAFNYLKSKGLSPEQAAGLVGNFMQEAGVNIDPKITNSIGHKGIAQWDPDDRWPKLVRFARSKNLNPESLEAQLQFVWYELETGDGGLSLSTLKGAKTVKQAAHLFVKQYERSGEGPGDHGYENRITYGNQVYSKYAKLQTGGVVQTSGHTDTGPGYTIQGALDQKGRPVVFSQAAASAFAKMMKDSGGVVKASDVASSKRSPSKNREVGGASKSKHMFGIAMDIHGSSEKWIRKNGPKYGWIVNDYPGSHGGHFEFGGQGIKPSDVSSQNQENATTDQGIPEVSFAQIAKDLNNLYKGLTGKPRIDGAQLQRNSMDMIQSQNTATSAFMSDTYIITPPTTIASSVNVLGPVPQVDYTMYTSYANFDSSTSHSQRRL